VLALADEVIEQSRGLLHLPAAGFGSERRFNDACFYIGSLGVKRKCCNQDKFVACDPKLTLRQQASGHSAAGECDLPHTAFPNVDVTIHNVESRK